MSKRKINYNNNMEIPGFRFYPTEEELVVFYLPNKIEGTREEVMDKVIPELNIYDYSPSDLPRYSGIMCRGDPEQCFFFIPRQESEARGGRPSRLTEGGYWKATGSPSFVFSSDNRIIGLKRTMVFYTGRAPNGIKTQWKMNEYKAVQGDQPSSISSIAASASTSTTSDPMLRQEFSLCRVYKKTKCLRAFDRRPTGTEIIISNNPAINLQHDRPEEPLTLSRQASPPAAAERGSSHDDSSSSGGGGGGGGGDDDGGYQPSRTGENEYLNFPMDIDESQALWDWDHFF